MCSLTETQGSELIEAVGALKDRVDELWQVTNTVGAAVLGCLLAIAFFSAMRAVRRA